MALGLALLFLTTGCLTPPISVAVDNRADTAQWVDVTVEQDGEAAFSRNVTVPAGEWVDNEVDLSEGTYIVQARASDGRNASESIRVGSAWANAPYQTQLYTTVRVNATDLQIRIAVT